MPNVKAEVNSPLCLFDKRSYKILLVSVQDPTEDADDGQSIAAFSHFSDKLDDIQSLVLLLEGNIEEFSSTDKMIEMRPPEDDTYFEWSRFPEVHVPSGSNARPRTCTTIQAELRVRWFEGAQHAKENAKKIRLKEGRFTTYDVGLPVLSANGALKGLIVYVGTTEAIVAPFIGNRPDLTVANHVKIRSLTSCLTEQNFLKNLEQRTEKSEGERIEDGKALREEFASAEPNQELSVEKYLKEFLR